MFYDKITEKWGWASDDGKKMKNQVEAWKSRLSNINHLAAQQIICHHAQAPDIGRAWRFLTNTS